MEFKNTIGNSFYRKRSRSKERDHDKSKRPSTTTERRTSPERKPVPTEDLNNKPIIKSETELKEEAAAAALMAKVICLFSNLNLFKVLNVGFTYRRKSRKT